VGLLITAFEPFGNDPHNTSETLLRALVDDPLATRFDVATQLLPVVYPAALDKLVETIGNTQPHTVICLGQDNSRPVISVEKVAINFLNYDIPDNCGAQPINKPVVAGGPAAYFSTLPVDDIVKCVADAGARSQISYSAGTYVCNALFYGLMHYIEEKSLPIRAGFDHVFGSPGITREISDAGMGINSQLAALKEGITYLSKDIISVETLPQNRTY
jgi:pyroglutamyl-peptidase